MPLFGFGFGAQNNSSQASAASAASAVTHHNRQSSLSLSSSDKNSRLAEIRAKTKASHLRQEMTKSGDLSISRSKGSSGHSRRSTDTTQYANRHIVAVEADQDDSRHIRIDQGIIDASKEAVHQQQKVQLEEQQQLQAQSWWAPVITSGTAAIHSIASGNTSSCAISESHPAANDSEGALFRHKTKVSKKFLVP